jgi:pseudaminic acid synthase
MQIERQTIGCDSPPFVIAEMSGNHNQSLAHALEIVDAAAKSGAHALKIQTYTPETMTLNINEREFRVSNPNSLWYGRSLYDLYAEAHTPWEWHKAIFDRAKQLGMIAFSTPFDSTSVDFLEELNVPCYKVASFENVDLPLIRKIAETGKPMIISTGMASLAELNDAVTAAREGGCKNLVLLKCTSAYPASPADANLLTIPHLRNLFKCEVGLSDHTMGIGVPIASVALGASVIEKHFTLKRADGGVDSAFSIEPAEMAQLVRETRVAWQSLGEICYEPTEEEKKSMVFRRSLYIVKDLKKGDILNEENVRSIRPGLGLSPKYFSQIIGKKLNKNVDRGTPCRWDLIG